ncbi:protein-disulfide reductase DsbD [Ideonella sp.]|uniref:protein-disulfide reductase DsbD n=1 Tax=Ideonella sp. TaxID=1929293 RepID=UPI002B47662E|nr:protein-disulfide reductase DsbD [Ideonella sp.]HJV71839.1 protein-disulfide reductase DsbD [Ideonella sp.]
MNGSLNPLRPWSPPLPAWLLGCLLAVWLAFAAAPARAADEFLEPEQAFPLEVRADGPKTLVLSFRTVPGYYLYREKLHFATPGATLGEPELPAGQVKFDENFQKNVETYHGPLDVRLPVSQAGADGFTLDVVSQGCADAGLCYPPLTRQVRVSLAGFGGDGSVALLGEGAMAKVAGQVLGASRAPAEASPGLTSGDAPGEGDRVQRVLQSGSWWTAVGAFWLMGLLLAFTPCVLPMLPILSSILTGGAEVSRRRGFLLAASYSLGMALVYTALGVAAGLAGEGLAAALQKPAVLAGFALLLALFSLSMFDVYELRLPHALSNKLDGASRRLPGGQLAGVFLMGGLSALIVSPCVTAPLAGALLFLSQTRDVALSASALFALAVGMSTPLLLLGASAGAWLPRSGAWMHVIKRFFGLVLLGVALWVVQPVLPAPVVLALWGALLLISGFMLRPFDANPHSGAPRVWLQRAAGVAALAWGVMMLGGAASGGRDPLQPLAHLAMAADHGEVAVAAPLPFAPVRSLAELDAQLQRAGRPVMLDFYADWCVSCKEMERFTFSDPDIRARLSKALLLKADVTANSDDDRALLKRFQLFGPPGTIFFDAQGKELREPRVIGFQNSARFGKSLNEAGL